MIPARASVCLCCTCVRAGISCRRPATTSAVRVSGGSDVIFVRKVDSALSHVQTACAYIRGYGCESDFYVGEQTEFFPLGDDYCVTYGLVSSRLENYFRELM